MAVPPILIGAIAKSTGEKKDSFRLVCPNGFKYVQSTI